MLTAFHVPRSKRGDMWQDERKFLEAVLYFTANNISWRALPAVFLPWNTWWKRFSRLSKAGVFEAVFDHLVATSESAYLVQLFDSTIARAHVPAAGAKGARRTGAGAVPRRLLHQDPFEDRH